MLYESICCRRKKKQQNLNKKGRFSYIVFDFKCTQDNQLQCAQGFAVRVSYKCRNCRKSWCGTYQNIINLCVVQKVCELYLHSSVTSESSCTSCCKSERVRFQWLETREDFCIWLLSDKNVGATAIWHNFMVYYYYHILQYLHENDVLQEAITAVHHHSCV